MHEKTQRRNAGSAPLQRQDAYGHANPLPQILACTSSVPCPLIYTCSRPSPMHACMHAVSLAGQRLVAVEHHVQDAGQDAQVQPLGPHAADVTQHGWCVPARWRSFKRHTPLQGHLISDNGGLVVVACMWVAGNGVRSGGSSRSRLPRARRKAAGAMCAVRSRNRQPPPFLRRQGEGSSCC